MMREAFRYALRIGIISLLSTFVTGCVTTPPNGGVVAYPTFNVGGYATEASATILIEAWNYATGSYQQVATTTASASATMAPGQMCSNGPGLYNYSTSVTLSYNYWDHTLTDPAAKLRLTERFADGSTQVLYSSTDPNAAFCVYNNITPGCDFYDVAYSCGFQYTEIPVHAIG